MKKKKHVSVMAAVALALGATAISQFPSFSEGTAIGAIAFEQGKVNARTKPGSFGKAQPVEYFSQGYTIDEVNNNANKPPTTGQCGKQQASGGQKGDRRTIKLNATKGKLRVYYDMLSIPDKLQLIYKGKVILDTGFVSGSRTRTITFNGTSNEVTVVVTGNPKQSGTVWQYTVYCPK